MRHAFLCSLLLLLVSPIYAQKKNFTYSFYGFVRGDLYYNSRANVEAVDGNFYLFPLNKNLDPNGKDMNAAPNSSFYTFTTRFGIDMAGPKIGSASTSAKVETDLGGFNLAHYTLRIRQAYVNLAWEKGSSLLLGQTWHPLFGEVLPDVLNLNTGSPFQPFNRSAQIRYQHKSSNITLTGSAIYQLVYLSAGPNGKSEEYQKNAVIPELFAGINYHKDGFLGGAGVEMLSLKPRLNSTANGKTFKVDERITSVSLMGQARYTANDWYVAGKTLYASNLTHTALLGGYGVTSEDPNTGKQEYAASRHSTSWLNVVYGKKWKGGAFLGYTKNLGTGKPLVSTNKFYGSGVDIDQLFSTSLLCSYDLPHWKAGVEYTLSSAWYGQTDLSNGKVKEAKAVTNHRILLLFMYLF